MKSLKVKGVTLVEVMICVFILGFLMAGMLSVLSLGSRVWRSDMALVEAQQQVRWTMRGMLTELRQSSAASINITGVADNRRIDFTVPDSPDTISYYLSANEIIREHPVGTLRTIVADVDNLDFCCPRNPPAIRVCGAPCEGSDCLDIYFQVTKTAQGEQIVAPMLERVRLRND